MSAGIQTDGVKIYLDIDGQIVKLEDKDFEIKGINKIIRPIVAPYILNSVLKRIADHISQMRNHPLTTRKYMWKTEY